MVVPSVSLPSTSTTTQSIWEISLQEKICHCIAQLTTTCPIEDVRQVLDPLIRSWDDVWLEKTIDDDDDSGRPVVDDDDDDNDDTRGVGNSDGVRTAPNNVGRITPLIVACDKGNVACLEYLHEKFVSTTQEEEGNNSPSYRLNRLQRFLGSPLDVSDVDRNTAMHHAAMAGCYSAITILQQIFILLQQHRRRRRRRSMPGEYGVGDDERTPHISFSSSSSSSSVDILLHLGTIRNSHNDTPLMMAVLSNNPVDFIRTWVGLIDDDDDGRRCRKKCNQNEACTDNTTTTNNKTIIRNALQAKNNSMDTCLSMGCTHGHVDLVQFLLEGHWDINVDVDEVSRCRRSFQRMDQTLNTNPDLLKQYGYRRDRVEVCLKLLESNLAATTERAVQELLHTYDDNIDRKNGNAVKGQHNGRGRSGKDGEDTGSVQTDDAARPKKGNKKKKRNDRQKRGTDGPVVLQTKVASSSLNADNKQQGEDNEEGKSSAVVLTTLTDGKIAVRVTGRDIMDDDNDHDGFTVPLRQTTTMVTTQSVDATDLLRDRFSDIFSESVPSHVDAVLSALCLDVRCLLYTEHGMALNLSSAQLDAVQEILRYQMSCVEKARDIQRRMHNTN